jgi:hypothetical protein
MTLVLRHRVHFDESLAPPLCAPARVIPGQTLVEGEGRGWLPGLPSTTNYAFWPVVVGLWGSCSRPEKAGFGNPLPAWFDAAPIRPENLW